MNFYSFLMMEYQAVMKKRAEFCLCRIFAVVVQEDPSAFFNENKSLEKA